MKVLGLGMVGFAFAATMVFAQGNQEAANLTKEGIEASKAKDWDKAITAFRKAAQLEAHYAPNLASALQQRATVYVSQKKFREAIADYSEALRIKSDDPDVYERRGYAEMQLKDYEKALYDYNQAIRLSPQEAKYYQVRALIYQNTLDFKAALADTEKTLQLDPNNADAQARKRFLDAKLHGTPTPMPMPSGPIPNPNAPAAAAGGGTPAPGKP